MSKISVTKCAELLYNSDSKRCLGTKLHNDIESYLKEKRIPDFTNVDEKKIFKHFVTFIKEHPHYKCCGTEKDISITLGNTEIKKTVSGRIDALFENVSEPSELILVDWKIMKDMDYSSLKKYSYAMNIYSKILKYQKKYKDKNIIMFLVLLHDKHPSYVMVPVREEKKALTDMLSPVFHGLNGKV